MPVYNMPRPRFTADDLNDEKQRKKIITWLVQMDEQLRYLLNNIDEENLGEALENRIEKTETDIITQEGLLQTKVSQTEFGDLEEVVATHSTVIQQTSDGVGVVVTKDAGTDHSETTVEITADRFAVNTELVELSASGGQSLHIDGDGATMDNLTVNSRLNAPNMVEKYVGKTALTVGRGGDYATLTACMAEMNGKYLPADVTVTVSGTVYENVTVRGLLGPGKLTVKNGVINGSVSVVSCAARVGLESVIVAEPSGYSAVHVNCCENVSLIGCKLTSANADALMVTHTQYCGVWNTELYGENGIECTYSRLAGGGLSGTTGRYWLFTQYSVITLYGTRPSGTSSINSTLITPADPDSLTVNGGSGGGTTPTTITMATMTASFTASRGNDWDNGTQIQQGYTGVEYKGCFWFDVSAISGKQAYIENAVLTMSRTSDAGQSGGVAVTLYVTPLARAASVGAMSGDPTSGAELIGVIGRVVNGSVGVFDGDLIKAAAKKLAEHPTYGLMVRTGESSVYPGKSFSENRAKFEGTEGNAPVLVVTYRG